MKRTLITLLLVLPLAAMAQIRIGYLSYSRVMQQMPEYAQVQEKLQALKVQYAQEAKRGEEEFQRKFSEFLQGQKDFPQNIMLKRQAELQSLMDSGVKFRQEAEQLLSKAEAEMMAEVKGKLDVAIEAVGSSGGYACVLNTDGGQCPFLNPALSEDVTTAVLQNLGVLPVPEAAPAEGQPAPEAVEEVVEAAEEIAQEAEAQPVQEEVQQ